MYVFVYIYVLLLFATCAMHCKVLGFIWRTILGFLSKSPKGLIQWMALVVVFVIFLNSPSALKLYLKRKDDRIKAKQNTGEI